MWDAEEEMAKPIRTDWDSKSNMGVVQWLETAQKEIDKLHEQRVSDHWRKIIVDDIVEEKMPTGWDPDEIPVWNSGAKLTKESVEKAKEYWEELAKQLRDSKDNEIAKLFGKMFDGKEPSEEDKANDKIKEKNRRHYGQK